MRVIGIGDVVIVKATGEREVVTAAYACDDAVETSAGKRREWREVIHLTPEREGVLRLLDAKFGKCTGFNRNAFLSIAQSSSVFFLTDAQIVRLVDSIYKIDHRRLDLALGRCTECHGAGGHCEACAGLGSVEEAQKTFEPQELTLEQELAALRYLLERIETQSGVGRTIKTASRAIAATIGATTDAVRAWDTKHNVIYLMGHGKIEREYYRERIERRLETILPWWEKPMTYVYGRNSEYEDWKLASSAYGTRLSVTPRYSMLRIVRRENGDCVNSTACGPVPGTTFAVGVDGEVQTFDLFSTRVDADGHELVRCPDCQTQHELRERVYFGFASYTGRIDAIDKAWEVSSSLGLDPLEVATSIIRITRSACRHADAEVQGALEQYEVGLQRSANMSRAGKWWHAKGTLDLVRSCWSGSGVHPVYDHVVVRVVLSEWQRLGGELVQGHRRGDEDTSGEQLQDWTGGPTVGVRGKLGVE